MRRIVIFISVLMLAASMIPGLTGCRESAAFVQTVYNQDFEDDVVDDDTLNDNQPENEDVEENLFSVDEREDADKERNFDESEPIHDSESTSDGQAANAEYLANARDNGTSTQSSGATNGTAIDRSSTSTQNSDDSERTGASMGTSVSGGAGNSSGSGGSGGGEGTGNGGGSGGGNGSGNNGDAQLPGSSNGTSNTPEPSEEINIPDYTGEHEITAGTMFATGNAAILVQMLGGEGALLGCDADTLNAMREYFPAEELAGVAEVWNSNGSINNEVVNRMDVWPEYCLVEEKDASAYKEAVEANTVGLRIDDNNYVALDFRYATGITDAVETVRRMVGTDYADSMAGAYMNFYSGIVETVMSKIGVYINNAYTKSYNVKPGSTYKDLRSTEYDSSNVLAYDEGKNTLFVFDWDESASWILSKSSSYTFYGSAVAEASYTASPVSYFMSIAGVENTAAQLASTNNLDPGEYRYICTTSWVNGGLRFTAGKYGNSYEAYISNSFAAEGLGGTYGKENDSITHQTGIAYGEFPALIAKNQYVKDQIVKDRDSGTGMWSVYPYDGNRRTHDFGNAGTFSSIISGDYDVYVNPSGLGDWAAGSAESVLESAWIASTFYKDKAYSDGEVRNLISEFYRTFYRCDNVNVESILAGKEN